MLGWIPVILVVAPFLLLVIVFIFIQRCCCVERPREFAETRRERGESSQNGIAKLDSLHQHHIDLGYKGSRTNNYYVFQRGVSSRPLFSWADHPSLVTDAVENGWLRFAFTTYMSSPSLRSTRSRTILGACASGDYWGEMEVDISWEVCQGSVDFMQKIRLNSGLKNINNTISAASMGALSVIKTALPLPGPSLGNSSFPQEAYFEITILYSDEENDHELVGKLKKIKSEGEKTKLIRNNSNPNLNSGSLIHVISSTSHGHGNKKLEELKIGGSQDDGRELEIIKLSLGLAVGGSPPLRLPGSYPGSIGFNSDGSVYLDGIKLVFESEKKALRGRNKVIGCGYNPSQRKVFFTLDSELVHVIHCKSEEFGTPLYPTLAANSDIEVLVNFGQSAFKYAPANSHRTPNPCFICPLTSSPALGYDSKELFSMGRIDSQWLNRSTTRNTTYNNGSTNKGIDFDAESESDLFEIVLDNFGKSPNTGR